MVQKWRLLNALTTPTYGLNDIYHQFRSIDNFLTWSERKFGFVDNPNFGKDDFKSRGDGNKISFLTLLWSFLAIREEQNEISRKGDFYTIIIISLWDLFGKDHFKSWGDGKNSFLTVKRSCSAIREEEIEISRKGDFHKISIITLWDHFWIRAIFYVKLC